MGIHFACKQCKLVGSLTNNTNNFLGISRFYAWTVLQCTEVKLCIWNSHAAHILPLFPTSLSLFLINFLKVNGVKHYLPLTLQDGKIKIYYSGSFAVVEADFGLAVKYNWNHHLVINLASKFSGQVCGLCGNYNDNPADDFVTPDGTAVSSGTEMGRSWKAKRDDGPFCVDDCNDQCPQCSEDLSRAYGTVSYCGLLVKQDGPFRDCHSWVDPEAYVLNCAFDLCVYQGDQTLFCRALKTYADTCQGAGIKVYDWRGITQCRKYMRVIAVFSFWLCLDSCEHFLMCFLGAGTLLMSFLSLTSY